MMTKNVNRYCILEANYRFINAFQMEPIKKAVLSGTAFFMGFWAYSVLA